MPFVGRDRATIRDEILSLWASEYATRGRTLLIAPGSDAYIAASGLAVILEGLEAQAEQTVADILPDQASTDSLNRHGYVDGVDRIPGVKALVTVTVTGPSAGNVPIAADTQMVTSDGAVFDVEDASVTLSGGTPTGTLSLVRSALDGAEYTPAVADTLTFATAPSGLNSTGAVASVLTDGTDEEDDQAYAARIIDRRRERPASGNRADWKAWVMAYTGTSIETAYVYARLQPPTSYPGVGTANVLGCVTVVAVGPAQGDSTVNTRIVPTDDASTRTPGARLPNIVEYIEGDRESDGSEQESTQLRPITMNPDDYTVQAINTQAVNVAVTIVPTGGSPFPWAGSLTVVSSTTSTVTVIGDVTNLSNTSVFLNVGNQKRGAYVIANLATGTYSAPDTTFPFSIPEGLPLSAGPTGTVYPAPGNAAEIQRRVFALFDTLAPGDTSPVSYRWPEDVQSVLYPSAIVAAILASSEDEGPPAALDAVVTAPASAQVPTAKTVITLGTLLITQ